MRIFKNHLIVSIAFLMTFAMRTLSAENKIVLLPQAHAHNDYAHTHPLFDALDQGFCSVEADIFLKDGKLLIAHESNQTSTERTLQSLYLDPLRAQVHKNHGHVYPNGPQFTLLIDLKQNWQTIYPALHDVLTNYADILTSFEKDIPHTNAILVIISGSRVPNMFAGETTRYATIDGDLTYLGQHLSPALVPWISINWKTQFSWKGQGSMPEVESLKLRDLVTRAHAEHFQLRFWGAPDNLNCWKTLTAASVDLINTDDLAGVQNFFRNNLQ